MDLKESLKYLKLRESAISMILGALVIVVSGILLVNYLSRRGAGEVTQIEVGDENVATSEIPQTHTVAAGENLWTISEKYYGTGYYWADIAKENGFSDADAISEGQTIKLPSISLSPSPMAAVTGVEASPTPSGIPVSTVTPFLTITPTPIATLTPIITQSEATSTPTPTVITTDGQGAMSTEARTHTVQSGESLWKIAEKFYQSGYNWVDIANANKIVDANIISSGTVLIIPNVQSKTSTVAGLSEVGSDINGTSYTVQEGDTLWNIAVRAYGDGYKWSEISRENKLESPNVIHKGNILILPR